MNLLLMGPPGAGKGTQGKFISERFSVPVISTGDILRANVSDGTELGGKAKGYMDSGELVPDALVLEMVAARLAQDDCSGGFILDGYPRNTAQAEQLDSTLTALGKKIDAVLGIEVEKGELLERLTGRRGCTNKDCGAGYHVKFDPPKVEGICDDCGSDLFQRVDDTEETIKARLKVYDEQTLPLIEYYTDKHVYKAVHGVGSMQEISETIASALAS